MNDHQKKCLQIFEVCLNIFDKLGLKYYAIAGTALGAVRHNGFIPWDDDIDIGMPRKDYDYFISVAKKYFPSNLFLQHYTSEADYPLLHAKVLNLSYPYVEGALSKYSIKRGVFIDIFPLDKIPQPVDFGKKMNRIKSLLQRKHDYPDKKNSLKSMIRRLSRLVLRLIPNVILMQFVDRRLARYSNLSCKYIANLTGLYGMREIHSSEVFAEGVTMKFEHLSIIIPKKYDDYLARMYGEYMKLPPIEERVPSHV